MWFRKSRHKGQSRHSLGSRPIAHVIFVHSELADSSGLHIDDARINLPEFFVAQAPFVHLAGTEVLAESIRLVHHPPQQVASFWMVEVKSDPVFAWIGVVVIGAAIEIAADAV